MAEAERKSNGASPVILPLFGLLEMHDQHSSSAMDSSKVQGSSTAAAAAAQLEVLCMSSSVEDHDGASRSGIFVGHDQFPLPATNSFKVEESSTTAAAAHLEFQGEASRSGSELETSSFQYSPLIGDADIRLVILEPGRDHGPVNCRLIHISLDESPVYEALSYAWGDATILGQTILLDGRPFSIGINLEGALLNLRDDAIENPGERTLWIDAISINQRDILERNAQVQKMKAIFSSATKVVIWLGNYHEPLDDSLEFDTGIWGFDRLDKGTREGLLRTNDLLGRMKRFYSELKKGFNQPDDSFLLAAKHDWGNLQRLFMRPWFERLWVVQELYLARKAEVICGRLTISWQDLEQACEALLWKVDKLKSSDGGLKLMLDSIEGWRPLAHTMVRGLPSRSLLALLYSFRNSKCTNARDRVYALLGICIDGQGIKVDYNSLIHDVYINWTWRQIETTKTLEVFSACNDSKAAGLPSWTPDLENGLGADRNEPYGFTSTILVDASTLYDSYGKLPYCASGRSVCNPTLSADRRILSLSGMHIDSLKAIFDPETALELLKTDRQFANLESLKDDNGIPSIIRAKIHYLESEVAKHFHLSELSYGSDDWIGFTDVLFRGLKNWHPFGDGNPEEIGNRYSTWRGFAPIDPHFEPEMKHKMRRAAYLEQVSWILMLILNSCTLRFYVTARGQIGVVHPALNAQVGDKVFVLFGGNTPFILRNEGEKHRLMGPCYQHGLMDGEAIAGWRISKYKTERITLV